MTMRLMCEANLYAAAAYASSGRSPSAARPASQKLFRPEVLVLYLKRPGVKIYCFDAL